jgi:hypothetical protein
MYPHSKDIAALGTLHAVANVADDEQTFAFDEDGKIDGEAFLHLDSQTAGGNV